jgi:hypothetical protein
MQMLPNLGSLNRTIEDCSGNTIIARTSGYARFAGEKTPGGKLKGVSVFSRFINRVVHGRNNWPLSNTNDISANRNNSL